MKEAEGRSESELIALDLRVAGSPCLPTRLPARLSGELVVQLVEARDASRPLKAPEGKERHSLVSAPDFALTLPQARTPLLWSNRRSASAMRSTSSGW